jgi:hypothetical protein
LEASLKSNVKASLLDGSDKSRSNANEEQSAETLTLPDNSEKGIRLNSRRANCKDTWNTFLVSAADYAGLFEIPKIQPTRHIPNRLIAFSKAISCKDHDQWVHFFQDDYLFERIWRDPKRYLSILKRFNGVILPDFSIYRDMPLALQIWNIYRSRALGSWLQANGIKIIVNVRYGDCRTYGICCDGISRGSTIAVGTHGILRNREDKNFFTEGMEAVIQAIMPSAIVVYGTAPEQIFGKYSSLGIKIIQFDSEFAKTHKVAK